ncbi:MAG: hypothetical protein JWP29_1949 [Rhodoferax sp.]|nr:hypothetical protein [Rhodoferax sp.]
MDTPSSDKAPTANATQPLGSGTRVISGGASVSSIGGIVVNGGASTGGDGSSVSGGADILGPLTGTIGGGIWSIRCARSRRLWRVPVGANSTGPGAPPLGPKPKPKSPKYGGYGADGNSGSIGRRSGIGGASGAECAAAGGGGNSAGWAGNAAPGTNPPQPMIIAVYPASGGSQRTRLYHRQCLAPQQSEVKRWTQVTYAARRSSPANQSLGWTCPCVSSAIRRITNRCGVRSCDRYR